MCERCDELPADTLVEHTGYGEAVCKCCVEDELWNEMMKVARFYGYRGNIN